MKKIFLIILLCFISYPALTNGIRSNVIILVDLSGSYFTAERYDVIEKNLRTIAKAIGSKKNGPDKPSLIQAMPIMTISQTQSDPLCEFTLIGKKLIKKRSADAECEDFGTLQCGKKKGFSSYMKKICPKKIHAFYNEKLKKVRQATDIDGAISLAVQLASGQIDDEKYLIIMSDMEQYRTEEIPTTPYKLNGFHVLVICSSALTGETGIESNFCMSDPGKFKKKLKDKGAESVRYVIESAQWHPKITKEFFR